MAITILKQVMEEKLDASNVEVLPPQKIEPLIAAKPGATSVLLC